MTHKQVYSVKNNQLVIKLPDSFRGKKAVLVTLDDKTDVYDAKMELMKLAKNDPLFLSDIEDVANDFLASDLENL